MPSAPHTDKGNRSWIPVAIALLGAGVLISWTSIGKTLWVDEEMLGLNARFRPFSGFGGALWLDQSAPLGWLLLERLILMVLGTGERAARLLTTAFGVATLGAAVWIGRRWMSSIGAAMLVALCASGEWVVFFTLELKHYSGDTFFALLVPALAAWALEGSAESASTSRRVATWWLVATGGMWFSNSAVFVTPACAVVLIVILWRRRGARVGMQAVLFGMMWVASFAVCYAVELRHAAANAYLKEYWSFAYPPTSRGIGATLSWWLDQLGPFAVKPGGCQLRVSFWAMWTFGIVFPLATRRTLSLMFATVPLSAVVLATLHVVPTFERLALWVVPALYVGIALSGDTGAALVPRFVARGRGWTLTGPALVVLAAFVVCADVVRQGEVALEARSPRTNYGLDDRSSIRWLLAAHIPGDLIATTHFGLAGLWWYSAANISDIDRSTRLADGSPLFELGHLPPDGNCDQARHELTDALRGHQRVVLYLGFRMNVLPVGFDDLAMSEFSRRGALVGFKTFADSSRVAVFDLQRASNYPGEFPTFGHEPATPVTPLTPATLDTATTRERATTLATIPGCVTLTPARRW
jgi:hypothetical protein